MVGPFSGASCLTTSEILGLLTESLTADRRAAAEDHLRTCSQCDAEFEKYRKAGLWRNLRAACWITLAGLASFGPGLLLMTLSATTNLRENLAGAYAPFPSEPVPWLTRINLPAIPPRYAGAAIAVFTLQLGLIAAWGVKPRSLAGAALTGLAAGLVAGLILFLTLAWTLNLKLSILTSLDDLTILRDLSKESLLKEPAENSNPDPSEQMLQIHPDLAEASPADRPKYLFQRIVAINTLGPLDALGISLPVSLVVGALIGMSQTVLANLLLRRQTPWHVMIVAYYPIAFLIDIVIATGGILPLYHLVLKPLLPGIDG